MTPFLLTNYQRSKSSQRPYCRTKYPINWASGGPGMQAVFLDSGKKSCGTGVFLPRRAGTILQSNKKPGTYCSIFNATSYSGVPCYINCFFEKLYFQAFPKSSRLNFGKTS